MLFTIKKSNLQECSIVIINALNVLHSPPPPPPAPPQKKTAKQTKTITPLYYKFNT